jgi:hypothetical protein
MPIAAEQAQPEQPAAPRQPAPPAAQPAKPAGEPAALLIPLRVRFVLTKYQGEKKLSSLPYDLTVNATPSSHTGPGGTRLRIGGDVPYPTTSVKPADDKTTQTPFQFRSVGTRIDCSALSLDDGRYSLSISIIDDSVSYIDEKSTEGLSNVPRFRTFSLTNILLLKDGQTTQMTAATDPISGEVMRVDVSLSVVK